MACIRTGNCRSPQIFTRRMNIIFKAYRFQLLFLFLFFLAAFRTVSGQERQIQKVTAQPGDGIHSLLLRHGLDTITCSPDFIDLNRAVLGRNNMLFAGIDYTLPLCGAGAKTDGREGSPKVVKYPIFGENDASIPIRDEKLKGAVYDPIADHGGPDPAAITRYGNHTISEHEYAYDET